MKNRVFILLFACFVPGLMYAQGSLQSISPVSGNAGETINATITLDPAATPPLPPSEIQPTSVTIGSISASSFNRTSNTSVTANFTIPAETLSGSYDVVVTFTVAKGEVTYTLAGGFEIAGASLTVFYVNPYTGSDAADGLSWGTAKQSIQAAADDADVLGGGEIWLMTGIYKPTTGTDRSVSFELKQNVGLYGGFAGTETDLSQRDYENNPTVLSGDIGVTDDASDNSYHVVRTYKDAVLDGLIIIGGNADGDRLDRAGGGIYLADDKASVLNCSFYDNYAEEGGAMYVVNINGATASTTDIVLIDHCSFSNNSANNGGAIVCRVGASSTISYCEFLDNTAEWRGGAIYIDYGAYLNAPITIESCNFSGNSTNGNGGAIYSDDMASQLGGTYWYVNSCNFASNTALYRGGAVSNYNNTGNYADFSGNNFSNNSAGAGGNAIANDNGVELTVNDNNFDTGQDIDSDATCTCSGNNCP